MKTSTLKPSLLGTTVCALITLTGCQNTKALDEVRATANKASQEAAAAKASADAANTSAANANKAANNAQATADKALNTANQALQAAKNAQSGVDATNVKLDRMFKQSVSK